MKILQRALASLGVVGIASLSMVAIAAPAQALPTCHAVESFSAQTPEGVRTWRWPTAGNRDFNCVMGRGNQGTAVRYLQEALNQCNSQSLTVDGIYGANTERAVRNVQAAGGIAQDGVYGPQTRSRMRWATNPGGCLGHG